MLIEGPWGTKALALAALPWIRYMASASLFLSHLEDGVLRLTWQCLCDEGMVLA